MADMTDTRAIAASPRKRRIRWEAVGDHAVLILGAFAMIAPLLMLLQMSTVPDTEIMKTGPSLRIGDQLGPNLDKALFESMSFSGENTGVSMFRNSLILGLGFALGKIVISMMAAYAIVYFRLRFATFAFWLIFTTLLLPLEVRIVPSYEVTQQLGLLNSYGGLIVPLIASATATFFFRQFFMSVPEELVEAARIDGAGPVKFFIDILVPLSKTMIAAIFIIMFVFGWNQYLWPTMIITDEGKMTLVQGIRQITQGLEGNHIPEFGRSNILAILAVLPPVAVVIFFQSWFVKGLVESEKQEFRGMGNVRLQEVTKTYPNGTMAVHPTSFDIADGELIVLVGPSGCGKSTLLRMVAGLEEITGGSVTIGGREVNDLDPAERDIAMVFQNYALYPHMSVYRNMAYGLKNRRTPKDEIDRKVREAAAMLNLTDYLERKPSQLSGGQRQRVAMGRAIVREPALFLFDEPLSNLDAKLRNQMRVEIRALQRRIGVTSMYVTHDQVEAMTMADRIVVLNGGRIEQIGTPQEIYHRPASTFVASFMGAPPMNLMPADYNGNGAVHVAGCDLPVGAARDYRGSVSLGVRPEDVDLLHAEDGGALPFDLDLVEELGAHRLLHGRVHAHPFVVNVHNTATLSEGRMYLRVRPDNLHLFAPDSGRRI